MKVKHHLEKVWVLAIIVAFIGASVAVSAKFTLQAFHPFTLITIRFLGASLFLLPFVVKSNAFNIRTFRKLFLVGLLGALNPILFFIALPFTQASVSPIIYASVPAMTALYLFITEKERLSVKQCIGIVTGLVGVSLIVLLPLLESGIELSALKGNILIFVGAMFFMLYSVKSKHSHVTQQGTSIALVFYFCIIALILSLPFTLIEISKYGIGSNIPLTYLLNGIYIGVVGTGVLYVTHQYAIKKGSTVTASLFTYFQPVMTIILAIIFLGEHPTPTFILGGVFAIVGAGLAAK